MLVAAIPWFAFPPRRMVAHSRAWMRGVQFLLATIVGLDYEVRGRPAAPLRPAIFAFKHQSAGDARDPPAAGRRRDRLETRADADTRVRLDPAACRHDPGRPPWGTAALRGLVEGGRAALARGSPIVIFPEGTRVPPGNTVPTSRASPRYRHLDCPVVPVALNSGVFWPRRSFVKRPGRIVVEFCRRSSPGWSARPSCWNCATAWSRRPSGWSPTPAPDRRRLTWPDRAAAGQEAAGSMQSSASALASVQRPVDDPHTFEVADRAQQIVATIAGPAGAAPDQIEQPVGSELPGVLWMLAPDHVAPGEHAAVADRHRQPLAAIHVGDQLPAVQVLEDCRLLLGADAERPAAARPAAIQAEHHPRHVPGAAMHPGIDTQAADSTEGAPAPPT